MTKHYVWEIARPVKPGERLIFELTEEDAKSFGI